MDDKLLQKVRNYATKVGYDSVRPAGKKGNYSYFHLFDADMLGHKTGLPHIIKINEVGQVFEVTNLKERMWAVNEEVTLLQNG